MFATVYAGLHHSNPRLWQEIKRHCRRRPMRGSTLVLLANLLCARSDAVAELCLGSTCSTGPVHEDNAGPEHAHATRPHALNTNRRHAAKGGKQAHLSTRMRRDHTRQRERLTPNACTPKRDNFSHVLTPNRDQLWEVTTPQDRTRCRARPQPTPMNNITEITTTVPPRLARGEPGVHTCSPSRLS